ncbi:hypothetical protein LTR53_013201 [Teratosphaeriaceae sp. CCFEE 6253]|nr:hypothetical protein LTR53_013201 [Teratosphaeriaceae sp. CCFEE 6253]
METRSSSHGPERRRYSNTDETPRPTSPSSNSRSTSSSSAIRVGSASAAEPRKGSRTAIGRRVESKPRTANLWSDGVPMDQRSARVVDRRMLLIKVRPEQLALIANNEDNPSRPSSASGRNIKDEAVDADGRNARGTFSKEHMRRHPKIEWLHRGQGRYLPAVEVKRDTVAVPQRRSRHSRSTVEPDPTRIKMEQVDHVDMPPPVRSTRGKSTDTRRMTEQSAPPPDAPAATPRRKRNPRDSLTDALTVQPQHEKRRRNIEPKAETPVNESRSSRIARRAKLMPSIENAASGRTHSHAHSNTAETSSSEEEDDDDEMGRYRKDTYDKDHVGAHPEQEFHHAGNGWWKKGPRPGVAGKGKGKAAVTEHVSRGSGRIPSQAPRRKNYDLDPNVSIHKEDLSKYPGQEFHHKGNGWYRTGPDPGNHRRSIWVTDDEEVGEDEEVEEASSPPAAPETGEEDAEESPEDDDVEDESNNATVSKAWAMSHPEVQWVHRGNARYVRKFAVAKASPTAPAEPTPAVSERRKLDPTYSKAYTVSHPDEHFHHSGNGRYKRGTRPSTKSTAPASESEGKEQEPEDSTKLFSKEYTLSHRLEKFHHRGQGRFARGQASGKVKAPAREAESDDESEDDDHNSMITDFDKEGVYNSDFVEAHPHHAFRHEGRGRWVRGLPPPGEHHRVSARGFGVSEWLALQSDTEDPETPAVTDLLKKPEGPDKFPLLRWYYRGGGKWGRLLKHEREALIAKPDTTTAWKQMSSAAQYVEMKRRSAAEAKLGRDTAAREKARLRDVAAKKTERPKMRRGRKSQQSLGSGLLETNGTGSKSQSRAPKPKPRMLEPWEDIIEEEDLPDIYLPTFEGSSPTPESATGAGDPVDNLLRRVYPALNTDAVLASLTKFDPATRSTASLYAIAANAQKALAKLQLEWVDDDEVTAYHAKIPRKPAKGGRVPVDSQVFEDRKEADLYDYQYDARRVGFQDPAAQRVERDDAGRELRKPRRNRSGVESTNTVPGWRFGEEHLEKRQSRQPNRYEVSADQPPTRKRMKAADGVGNAGTPASMTPDPAATPPQLPSLVQQSAGRFANVSKRIMELRDESVVSARSESGGGGGPQARKGRPPGSKNLAKRRDAGIPKGPRKKKVVAADGGEGESAEE